LKAWEFIAGTKHDPPEKHPLLKQSTFAIFHIKRASSMAKLHKKTNRPPSEGQRR